MDLSIRVAEKPDIKEYATVVAGLLKEQGKVSGDLSRKYARCNLLCLVSIDNQPIGMGAIKEPTRSDFTTEKADLPSLADDFAAELGYIYIPEEHSGKGYASAVVKLLLEHFGHGNLMASTEIVANPGMVKILERHGFRQFGKPWKSGLHENYLGLFLKFAPEPNK